MLHHTRYLLEGYLRCSSTGAISRNGRQVLFCYEKEDASCEKGNEYDEFNFFISPCSIGLTFGIPGDSLQPSSPLPRRTSSRLARASFAASQKAEDDSGQFNPVGSHPGPCSNSFEVAIPLKNVVSRYTSSSSTSTEENSGDGTNEYNTPATSVAVTPIESDIKSRKRISASTRARELRSSAYSLSNTQRGVKRTSTAMSVDNSKTEDSDAALARVLQLEEYRSPKRQKPSRNNSNIEVQVSDDDCCPLTDTDEIVEMAKEGRTQRQPHPGSRVSLAAMGRTIIPDSEDFYSSDELKDGLMDTDELGSDSSASDFDSPLSDLPSSEDDEPLVSQLPEDRNKSITRRRALPSRCSAPTRPLPPGMSRRVSWPGTSFFDLNY